MSRSLVDRATAYVRGHPLLRVLLGITFVNWAASALMAARGDLKWHVAGYLVLMSLLTWFFGVILPMMNRSVRESLGADPVGYWGGIVEVFARVVLCLITGLHTALLTYRLLALHG